MATAIPKTMKGVLVEKTGGVEVLDYRTDLPVPSPKEGDILVKNDFIGINYIDVCVRPPLFSDLNLSNIPTAATSAPVSTTPLNPRS
jgi:NADPH:quinone reductase-like Zn-dependent oxidoreductase